ncbi:uncharacterized protein G2W53_009158 [Senna tora]|uniref:Uncharacterized protein n=1 Tax=Senna tora TaxID=362788 RepID=A0A835C7M2_9FABA|nr:uncharacterized protein G2W53_009158 [Senna tora]
MKIEEGYDNIEPKRSRIRVR